MKKTSLTLLLLFMTIALWAQGGASTSLVVLLKDGTTTKFELSTKPQVTFDGANLKIHSDETDATIVLADMVRYWFETQGGSDVTELKGNRPPIDYEDGTLILGNLKAGTTAYVYTIDGRLVKTLITSHDGIQRMNLSELPTGVYNIKVNSNTLKIMKP